MNAEKLSKIYWELRKRVRTRIKSQDVKDAKGLIQFGPCIFIYRGKAVYFEMGCGTAEYFRVASLFFVEWIDRCDSFSGSISSTMVEILRNRISFKKFGKNMLNGLRGSVVIPRQIKSYR